MYMIQLVFTIKWHVNEQQVAKKPTKTKALAFMVETLQWMTKKFTASWARKPKISNATIIYTCYLTNVNKRMFTNVNKQSKACVHVRLVNRMKKIYICVWFIYTQNPQFPAEFF